MLVFFNALKKKWAVFQFDRATQHWDCISNYGKSQKVLNNKNKSKTKTKTKHTLNFIVLAPFVTLLTHYSPFWVFVCLCIYYFIYLQSYRLSRIQTNTNKCETNGATFCETKSLPIIWQLFLNSTKNSVVLPFFYDKKSSTWHVYIYHQMLFVFNFVSVLFLFLFFFYFLEFVDGITCHL